MNKEFADELIEYCSKKGFEISEHICKRNGGNCVDGTKEYIISLIEDFLKDQRKYDCRSANYRVITDNNIWEEYDGSLYKELIVMKDYITIKIPVENGN